MASHEGLIETPLQNFLGPLGRRCFPRRFREDFVKPPDYYATALHELAHWTGHHSRLGRHHFLAFFGTPAYAREELRAEIASAMMSIPTGIPHDPSGHASYVAAWLQALERNQREIFRAASDAQRIVDYVLAFDEAAQARVPVYRRKAPPVRAAGSFVSSTLRTRHGGCCVRVGTCCRKPLAAPELSA